MADTKVRTYSLLTETVRKIEELGKKTQRRNPGDVIDWAIAEMYERTQWQPRDIDQRAEVIAVSQNGEK